MDVFFAYQEWPYAQIFRISRSESANSQLFVVYVREGDLVGRGECGLLPQYGQTEADVADALVAAGQMMAHGATRSDIAGGLPIHRPAMRSIARCGIWSASGPIVASGSLPV